MLLLTFSQSERVRKVGTGVSHSSFCGTQPPLRRYFSITLLFSASLVAKKFTKADFLCAGNPEQTPPSELSWETLTTAALLFANWEENFSAELLVLLHRDASVQLGALEGP